MSLFFERLDNLQPDASPSGRDWIFVPYDQLHAELGPLGSLPADEVGIVMVETSWKGERRPYHKQKLAMILANQRQFALEQARRGVAVEYRIGGRRYGAVLEDVVEELGTLRMMMPAERELLVDLHPLESKGDIEFEAHEGWLTSPEQFEESQDGVPWRMDAFYRRVRQDTGVLMEDGSPVGGKYSFDADNREFWSGEPPAPQLPHFELDAIDREVVDIVESDFDHHPGELHLEQIPTTRQEAEQLWAWARRECMEHFGPFEDAMSRQSRTLFHTRLSPMLNTHRLRPQRVLDDIVEMDIPLNSKEGFVRQVLGWREFMRHVHKYTDGFRCHPETAEEADRVSSSTTTLDQPDDGGWSHWRGESWMSPESDLDELDGGATPDFLDSDTSLPPAFWGETSGLECLDEVAESVGEEGWSHHITRLMVLSNIATMPNVLEGLTGYTCDIDFQGTVCSVISMDESLLDTYWLNIADDAPFGALIEHTNFVSAERYGGEHLLYVARYIQDESESLWQQSDDEVAETWLDGIESLFPDMVIPYDLGDAVADGLYYAGMASRAQYPERSLNGGIVAGFECADRIARDPSEATGTESPLSEARR